MVVWNSWIDENYVAKHVISIDELRKIVKKYKSKYMEENRNHRGPRRKAAQSRGNNRYRW